MKRYLDNIESNVEYLGQVPKNWQVVPLKLIVASKISDGPHLTPDFVDEGGVPFLSVESIQNSKIDFTKRRGNISVNDHLEFSKKCKPQLHDILLVKSASVGKVAIVDTDQEFNIWSPLALIRIGSKGVPRYFLYFLLTDYFKRIVVLNSGFNTQLNIGMGVLENLKVLVPPLPEQHQIVSFLDAKTTQIDRLVALKQRKIELLKEYRTALINRVVTKGLDPTVPMKDSGVEWIGEIPEGWEVKRLKFISNLISEKGVSHSEDVKISPENIESGTGRCLNFHSDYQGEGVKFEKNDILINKLRFYLRKNFFCDSSGFSMGEMIVLRFFRGFSKFYFHLFFNQILVDYLDAQSTGVKLPRVSPELILNLHFPVPPLSEQKEISNHLDLKLSMLEEQIGIELRKVDFLLEYRQSLISSVVTGKIDVRTEVLDHEIY